MTNISSNLSVEKLENLIIKIFRSSESEILHTYVRTRFFVGQDINEKIDDYENILRDIKYTFHQESKNQWELNYVYRNKFGKTTVRTFRQFDPEKPTLIFHHGLGDTLSYLQLATVTNLQTFKTANVFVLKAAHHENKKVFKKHCINSFTSLAIITCASTLAVEEMVKYLKKLSDKKIIVTGISMGGVVTSLHFFTYNTADYYFPINSHPDFGKIMINEQNKNLLHNYMGLSNNQSLLDCFNVKNNIAEKSKKKIFPILGNLDTAVNYKESLNFWKGYNIKTLTSGHFTVIIKRSEIIDHILEKSLIEN